MSTRATITVADEQSSFDIYQHHDGYPEGPHGLVRHIAMTRRLAWTPPRFEAADFAAAARHSGLSLQVQNQADGELVECGHCGRSTSFGERLVSALVEHPV